MFLQHGSAQRLHPRSRIFQIVDLEVEVAGAKVYPPQAKADVKVGKQGMWGERTWLWMAWSIVRSPSALSQSRVGTLRKLRQVGGRS